MYQIFFSLFFALDSRCSSTSIIIRNDNRTYEWVSEGEREWCGCPWSFACRRKVVFSLDRKESKWNLLMDSFFMECNFLHEDIERLAGLRYFYEPRKQFCVTSKFLLVIWFEQGAKNQSFFFGFNLHQTPTSDEETALMHFYFRRFQRAKQCMKWMWKMQFRCIIKQFTYLNSFFGIPLFPFRCSVLFCLPFLSYRLIFFQLEVSLWIREKFKKKLKKI